MKPLYEQEIEVKVLGVDHETIAARILALGGEFVSVEYQENYRLNALEFPIRGENQFRLRTVRYESAENAPALADFNELTYKKRVYDPDVRRNEEHTISVEDVEKTLNLLSQIGYTVVSKNDKKRTTYRLDEAKIEFDEWNADTLVKPYFEIEVPDKETLNRILDKLEIPQENVSTKSIGQLQKDAQLERTIEFSVVIEEMKRIFRQTHIIGEKRYENDAEHSWHIATNAILFERYADQAVDMAKVIQMLLVHDLVEIYAGDTFAYDAVGSLDMKLREQEAMQRIQAQLDEKTGEKIAVLWSEFEAQETFDSHFALAMDRLQPIVANLRTGTGGSWSEHGVHIEQVYKRIEPVEKASKALHTYLVKELQNAVKHGWLLP